MAEMVGDIPMQVVGGVIIGKIIRFVGPRVAPIISSGIGKALERVPFIPKPPAKCSIILDLKYKPGWTEGAACGRT